MTTFRSRMARAMRADLLDAKGDEKTALAEYKRALVDSPGEIWIRFGYVQLLIRRQLWNEADAQLKEAANVLNTESVDTTAEFHRLQQLVREHNVSVHDPAPGPPSR